MILRGIDYGPVWGASGVQGIFGEGYSFHKAFRRFIPGFSFRGMTFVAKTVTAKKNDGNLPLKADGLTLEERVPRCIVVKPFKAAMLNAVGLSNAGAHFYLEKRIWQKLDQPFCLSFMGIAETPEGRLREARIFATELKQWISEFKAPVALQANKSCPNVNKDTREIFEEAFEESKILADIGIPLIYKFNVLISPQRVREFMDNPNCDGVCVSNTIPYGQFPDKIDWAGLFGSVSESPLIKRGFKQAGGLSGAPIFPIVLDWCERFGKLNPTKPWIAGGGIIRPQDAKILKIRSGASAISLGSIATLRPFRLGPTIKLLHELDNRPYPSK